MKILAFEPYYGGSHKAFLEGLEAASSHNWTLYKLPAYKWKWRMRHSAVTFAEQVSGAIAKGDNWDLIFCSDMLNLAEFLGLAPPPVRNLPAVVYFHENQLTYPVQVESERDYQFAMTNMTTALAAKSVWFNSAFHKDSFLKALGLFLRKMPDSQPTDAIDRISKKACVYPPGVNDMPERVARVPGALKILWAARWEHDKNPEDFFEALKILKAGDIDFRLSVIGQQFRDVPEVFGWAKQHFARHIDRWGYQAGRSEYEKALTEADVFVSTADHEFFGITAVEAAQAGVFPLLPERLAYPEIFGLGKTGGAEKFFYDGSPENLAEKLAVLAARIENNCLWEGDDNTLIERTQRYRWQNLAGVLDGALAKTVEFAG